MRLFALFALVATAACSNAPSDSQCEALVAHVIELELDAKAVEGEARSELAKALEAEVGEPTRTFCDSQLSLAQVECGLAAKTSAELAECDSLRP